MTRFLMASAALVAFFSLANSGSAEVLVLANGGRMEGELLNPEESPRTAYVFKLASGGQITLKADQVSSVIKISPEVAAFEKIRSQYPDTAEGQWKLAEWCKDHEGLDAQRKACLKRVIELDPEHAQARRLLGYILVDGKWTTKEDHFRELGYVFDRGTWKTPQEKELADNRDKMDRIERKWFADIKRYRDWVLKGKEKEGLNGFRSIRDPLAVKALHFNLNGAQGNRQDTEQSMRLIYVEVLGRIDAPEAKNSLAIGAIDDEDDEVRQSCLDELEKTKPPIVIKYFSARLMDKNNVAVQRAGFALGRMKDPSSIPALINALITAHKETIGGGAGPGSMTTTFGTHGTPGGGLSMNQKPKVIVHHMQNQSVLDALVGITGQNFGFDQRAWATWYATQTKSKPVDVRRG